MMSNQRNYAIIVGHGRSGTNWLLELLDLSDRTHCRNEPNELAGTPLHGLPSPDVRMDYGPEFGDRWDEAVTRAARSMGGRDPHFCGPKTYVYDAARRLGAARAVTGPRLRRSLGVVMPALRGPEWSMPWWLGRPGALANALAVLKLNQVPGWADWVLAHRPHVPVLHIVRHPGGFLNSWASRYLAPRDRAAITRANADRLQRIVAHDRRWQQDFGDIEAMSPEESELWYWMYANQVIHEAGEGHRSYCRIVYEQLVADTRNTVHEVYRRCGLPWSPQTEARVDALTGESQAIASKWRRKLDPHHVTLVETVLERTSMRDWWPEAAVV